jgi:hypothetical protein
VLYDIGRQPRAAHDFFVKYQDRILFGKDSFQPDEYPYYWRVFETRDDYFDYYRDYHASWKLYGIDLPDAVLKKVYFAGENQWRNVLELLRHRCSSIGVRPLRLLLYGKRAPMIQAFDYPRFRGNGAFSGVHDSSISVQCKQKPSRAHERAQSEPKRRDCATSMHRRRRNPGR